ncbi:uncharacterized protein SCHCODRAFT_02495633 [Schizophyllum commune H4-8]|uniref:Uncharacterized protein n=1 Tax=Schizophyllum commune (strain H4-8 / FGSC 9210) TaxID=578458 RepID=D8Q1J9_SCHCM|nr:uncharacterized protein SCHCODRAFT_02495633 [Schizophyllum commune H4-8]KAI5895457.1 hypothetical protein SCHCODRAFT_02495633 [Schizophyllum commune H4-8]
MAQHTQAVLNLSAAVEAGAARVLGHCQTFQQLFQPRRMSEIGLTDQFMIGAKAQAGTALVMDWMNAENTSGADMVFTSGGVTYVFQAKVAERVGTQLSADFLYESTIKVNGQTVTNFQAVLLADYAASINGRA